MLRMHETVPPLPRTSVFIASSLFKQGAVLVIKESFLKEKFLYDFVSLRNELKVSYSSNYLNVNQKTNAQSSSVCERKKVTVEIPEVHRTCPSRA
jgi:hypothetical protein